MTRSHSSLEKSSGEHGSDYYLKLHHTNFVQYDPSQCEIKKNKTLKCETDATVTLAHFPDEHHPETTILFTVQEDASLAVACGGGYSLSPPLYKEGLAQSHCMDKNENVKFKHMEPPGPKFTLAKDKVRASLQPFAQIPPRVCSDDNGVMVCSEGATVCAGELKTNLCMNDVTLDSEYTCRSSKWDTHYKNGHELVAEYCYPW